MNVTRLVTLLLVLALPAIAQTDETASPTPPQCVERQLACGTTIESRLPGATCRTECGEDAEFFRVQVFVQTTLVTVTASSQAFDPRLDMLDASGAVVASNDSVGGTTTAQLARVLDPGSYYFRVVGQPAGLTGDYRITLACLLSDRKNFCFPDATTICLGGRFSFKVAAHDHQGGAPVEAVARTQSELHGFFSFPSLTGNPDNPEVFVKLIDGRAVNGRWWIFWGGLTDLDYELTVRDSFTRKEMTVSGQGSDTVTFREP
ncbi:MAG: hypothetical protein WC538_14700 [Thermoanaerobaculia bacterium]|jgi:hypothetical protein